MGAQLASGSGGGRRRGRRNRRKAMSDINVTPMVDVMLVLLVIFMVAAPLMTVGVEVDLPETSAAPMTGQDEPLVVSVTGDGTLYIMDSEVPQDTLAEKLSAITENKRDTRIFVRGDRAIDYGRVMEVMGLISEAGFSKVALIAELPEKGK
ncbi:protein TolR [Thalassospira lucentensis]|jgi:biopolymer transport protein TolR|uniref:Biopolymer transporter ExbD n=3 Tax=Thalassospira TaxID=168934 RepID=A0A154KTD8_9PROT|nr:MULTISPECIES: protein TolR [Thalassospira]KZB53768.1 protein TolR [Thalassospira xiamenensis]KZB64419.1 protein TolR [Thalassospira lucentensis]MAZ31684.1 protein TolR [Thalassospira sp.]MBO9508443.1 protein TolR [Thalassospira sp. A3_1]MCH2274700.1 protein TolR [Thalassospira sp.]|tara:strand:+ start:93 stop:545 length:453 start_codon:yes stop_codon:yes gene_type:complete